MAKCYIAGPMSGYDHLNYPAFHRTAAQLRAMGFEVVSPAELNDISCGYREAMLNDIRELIECDHICMLDGWEKSKGATLEHHIAQVLDITIITLNGDANETTAN
jgi:hypothetical protein